MKTILKLGIKKAIVFLATAVFLATSCQEVPPTVVTGEVSVNITEAKLTAWGKVTRMGSEQVTDFGFCVSKHAEPTISDLSYNADGPQANFNVSITDLEVGQTYFIRAYARSLAGIGYGQTKEVAFNSLSKVKTLEATQVRDTIATLRAEVHTYGYATNTYFEISSPSLGLRQVPVTSEGEIELEVGGLARSETHSYTIVSENEHGIARGKTASFKTCQEIVKDYDGNEYIAIKIGEQVWLQSNLKTTHFLNGDPIPEVTDNIEWINQTGPARCYYDNDPQNGEIYGALYNYHVGVDPRGLVAGYKIMSDKEDWSPLILLPDEARDLMSPDYWLSYEGLPVSGITNSTGFSALPGGRRRIITDERVLPINSEFSEFRVDAFFWTSDKYGVYGDYINLTNTPGSRAGIFHFQTGLSIRLVKE
ncbi:MAG: fibrobacter succinogenes major paralogous domain-containing protein [Patescibacteria group bacterium]